MPRYALCASVLNPQAVGARDNIDSARLVW